MLTKCLRNIKNDMDNGMLYDALYPYILLFLYNNTPCTVMILHRGAVLSIVLFCGFGPNSNHAAYVS